MKLLFLFFIFLSQACQEEFQTFMKRHRKSYSSVAKLNFRKRVFCENLDKINEINSRKNITWNAAINRYSDKTWEEFKIEIGLLNDPQNCSATNRGSFQNSGKPSPDAFDWRNETCGETSCVSMVKNQGSCGSCWTFSTVGALEAAHAIKTNMMTLLSEQQLVDCAQNFNNFGCNGGLPSQAFEYINYNGGLDTMASYPYVCGDGHCKPVSGPCKFNENTIGVKVSAVYNFTSGDENSMTNAVGTLQPISVAFEVVDDLMHYSSGVYASTNCKKGPDTVNHAVLAVGYGSENGVDYWIIKNSWSEGWGDRGYFKMVRGSNMCGVATCSSYPVVESNP